jgi:phage-related baseplate assembly protein
MTEDNIKRLDDLMRPPSVTRMFLPEDHPDARWDPLWGLYVESDEALRKRIKEKYSGKHD